MLPTNLPHLFLNLFKYMQYLNSIPGIVRLALDNILESILIDKKVTRFGKNIKNCKNNDIDNIQ